MDIKIGRRMGIHAKRMKIAKEVPLEITREELVERLGPPTDLATGSRKYPTPAIYKYGTIEFHFEPHKNGVLVFIGCDDEEDNFITIKSHKIMAVEKTKRDIEIAKRLWDRDDYLDRIIAGNKMMWARLRIKDMISSGEITPEKAEELMT